MIIVRQASRCPSQARFKPEPSQAEPRVVHLPLGACEHAGVCVVVGVRELKRKIHILMINDRQCWHRWLPKEFQHNYFVLRYKSLLHIKCSQWVVNQQPTEPSEALWERTGARKGGMHVFRVSFGARVLGFWTVELPACKSIENNLLLLIISERSCAADKKRGGRPPGGAWESGTACNWSCVVAVAVSVPVVLVCVCRRRQTNKQTRRIEDSEDVCNSPLDCVIR